MFDLGFCNYLFVTEGGATAPAHFSPKNERRIKQRPSAPSVDNASSSLKEKDIQVVGKQNKKSWAAVFFRPINAIRKIFRPHFPECPDLKTHQDRKKAVPKGFWSEEKEPELYQFYEGKNSLTWIEKETKPLKDEHEDLKVQDLSLEDQPRSVFLAEEEVDHSTGSSPNPTLSLGSKLLKGLQEIKKVVGFDGQPVYQISDKEVRAMFNHIENNAETYISNAKTKNEAILIHADESKGLHRSLVVTPEGDVFLLFNRKKHGDQKFSGLDKDVSRSIHLNTGEIYASAGIKTRDALFLASEDDYPFLGFHADIYNERILKEKNVPNVSVSTQELSYKTEHFDKVRRFSPFQERGDLAHALENGSLTKEEKILFSKQLAEAVLGMHRMDIAHRDIKSQNILLGEKGALLADFGTSGKPGYVGNRPFHQGWDKGFGTGPYLPPEARPDVKKPFIIDIEKQGKEGDIWSLGLVFLQVHFDISMEGFLYNKFNLQPFYKKIQESIGEIEGKYPNNPYIHLIKLMLNENPLERITAEQLVAELGKFNVPAPLFGS